MRLIDADVLKEDLTAFYQNEVTARQLIDRQPTASPWHKVEDELPPDNRFVLVCNDDHRYGVAQYVGDDGLTPWQIAYCLYDGRVRVRGE